jgi:hypothetical protein
MARFMLWTALALLVTSAICRITIGETYRTFVRETFLWWLPDPKDSLRPEP